MKEVVFEAKDLERGSLGPALETFLRRQTGIHHIWRPAPACGWFL